MSNPYASFKYKDQRGRKWIKEPAFVAYRAERVKCNHCGVYLSIYNAGEYCAVCAAAMRRASIPISLQTEGKREPVIGGGPAGLQDILPDERIGEIFNGQAKRYRRDAH